MATFSEVRESAKRAHGVTDAVTKSASVHVEALFEQYRDRRLTLSQLRSDAIKEVEAAYLATSSIAASHIQELTGVSVIPKVDSRFVEKVTDDVKRNFADFKATRKEDSALRKLLFRTKLSVEAAAQRGHSEAQIQAIKQASEEGIKLKKIWLANFVNNEPCPTCVRLHGTELDIDEEFPHSAQEPKVYENLNCPPRHPNCHCYLMVFVASERLEGDSIEDVDVTVEQTMTSEEVRQLPKGIFASIIAVFSSIVSRFRRQK